MWISNRSHVFCVRGIRLHSTGVFSNVLMKKKRQGNRKTSDWSKSDCSGRGFCRDVYGVRLYLPTRFEPGIARNTEVIADRTI